MLGVCGLIQLSELPDGGFGQLLPFALFGALLASRWRLVCLLIAGFLWALLRAHMAMEGNLPPALEGRDLVVQGSIVSIPVHKGYRKRFVFLVEGGSERNVWSGRTRLSWYHPTMGLQAGQRWRLTVRLKRPRGFMNPGGLDYEKWLFQHRIAATGYVRARGEAVLLEELAGQPINRARGRILAFIETVLNQHRQRGTVAALAIGDRQSISTQQWMVLRSTGTNHLMAISHHGSRTSSGSGFLDAVRPDHVVFPVGFNNRFGFPHADVLDRYRRRGIALHDTAQDGAVTFTLLPRGAVGEPGKFRDHAKRFWNQ